jgi:TonB-dependent receptor
LPDAAAFFTQASEPISLSQSDSHTLPSFNMKWNLTDDMLIRFGASQNLTRPNIQDMRAYTTYAPSTLTTQWPVGHCATIPAPVGPLPEGCNDGVQNVSLIGVNAGGGNPRLAPTTSDNFDISFEWYFANGYVSAAAFQKSLTDLISGGSESLGSVTVGGDTVPVTYNGQVNTRSVDLNGLEFSYQQFYDFLPGWMSNLGAQANFTYIDASTDEDTDCVNNNEPCRFGITDLFGVSEYLANVVGIYQDEQIEARLAYSWRSEYLLVKGDYMTGNPTFNQPGGYLDASFKYNFNEHLQLTPRRGPVPRCRPR